MRIIQSILVAILFFATGQVSAQNKILGKWESDKKDVRLEFYQVGDEYCARILWGAEAVKADGVTSKLDIKNPDESKRNKPILGSTIVRSFKWNGKEYTGGKIYNPPSGSTYSCKAWFKGDKLFIRGFLGVSLLGQTQSFHRYEH